MANLRVDIRQCDALPDAGIIGHRPNEEGLPTIMYRLLTLLMKHPLNANRKGEALLRFLRWQIGARLNPYPIVYPFTERSKLLIAKGMTGATGNLYCGLHDFAEMGFLLHFLRPGDLFVDVGANVGSYTILASAEIGAASIAIEPSPSTFAWLNANVVLNGLQNLVESRNVGVGGEQGTVKFTRSLDTTNHVASTDDTDVIDIPIDTLDNIINHRSPLLIKIDVEGYESEVLRGGRRTLEQLSARAIIIELNGSGTRYGSRDADVHRDLLAKKFSPYAYDPLTRSLSSLTTFGPHNTIYLKDHAFVTERVRTARRVSASGVQI